MQIVPNPPLAFSHIGQRPSNQDALFPADPTEHSRLLLVCDGMGGTDRGDVASQLLCAEIADYARALDYPPFDSVHLRTALDRAVRQYRRYLAGNPTVGRMGSTLALLQLHEAGITIAHIGDSRVYQIRDGQVLFRTHDHRQVLDMVDAGIITASQALTHPWRNRLSRAVLVNADPAIPAAPATPDLVLLTDVRPDDYFFLCTDGVGEAVDEDTLCRVLAARFSDQAKLNTLLSLCAGTTHDNYSGFLLSIRAVTSV
ncbi:protein phosphatase 2C domain-containing protein [Spirosoma luteolum]